MDSTTKNIDVIGYHGTDGDSVREINIRGFKLLNSNPSNWLGDGVYFFQSVKDMDIDGFKEAESWAKRTAKYVNSKSYGVFEARIKSGKVFDSYGKREHRILFWKIKHRLESVYKGDLLIDQRVYLILREKYSFELFRILADGRKIKYPSYTIERPQVIICIKNLECIKEKKLIKQGEFYGR